MSALSLSPRALYEEVAELLRQRIFQRELEPGSWIDDLKIAEAELQEKIEREVEQMAA